MTVPSFPLQLRSGNTAECDAHTGELAEVTVDTEAKNLRLHDGVTPGGLVIGAVDLSGYSLTTHNHDAAYAAIGHDHDAAYAAIGHNHDSAYHPLTTVGIADNNLVEMDDPDAAISDYAKFTANGLEGRSYAEVRADLDLEPGTDFYSVSGANSAFEPKDAAIQSHITHTILALGANSYQAHRGDHGYRAYRHAAFGDSAEYSLGAGDDYHLDAAKIVNSHLSSACVKAGNLNTSESTVYTTIGGGSATTISGGQYCFWPQIKVKSTVGADIRVANGFSTDSYTTAIYFNFIGTPATGDSIWAKFKYVNASGPLNWYFLLIEKATGRHLAGSLAPDHVCFGNGGDPEQVPHPFMNIFDPAKHEIVVCNPLHTTLNKLFLELNPEKEDGLISFMDIVKNHCELVENKSEPWPDIPVTTGIKRVSSKIWAPITKVVKPVPYINVLGLRKKEAGK